MKYLDSDENRLGISFCISAAGSAFSGIFIPLLIYQQTKNPIMSALHVSLSAVANLVASQIVDKVRIAATDKDSVLRFELLSFFTISILAMAPVNYLIPLIFLATILLSTVETCARGYHESIMGALSFTDNNNRQSIVGKIKLLENSGSLIGIIFATLVMEFSNFRVAFWIDGISFLLSYFMIKSMSGNGLEIAVKSTRKFALSVLFRPNIILLTLSHSFSSVALNIFNGTAIFILKNSFGYSNLMSAIFFSLQFFASALGSYFITKISKINPFTLSEASKLRMAYAVPFLIVAFTSAPVWYLIAVTLLAGIHAFSIPIWQSFFQELADDPSDWRTIGSARKTLVGCVGALASLVGGASLSIIDYRKVYLLAGLLIVVSAFFLLKYSMKDQNIRVE